MGPAERELVRYDRTTIIGHQALDLPAIDQSTTLLLLCVVILLAVLLCARTAVALVYVSLKSETGRHEQLVYLYPRGVEPCSGRY